MRSIIKTDQAPAAIGPYSQAILVGNVLYCSGQIPLDPETGTLVTDGIEAETERVLENLKAILKAAKMQLTNVVSCRVYLKDMKDYGSFNEVYARYFKEALPARETVAVLGLPRGANIEISCVAVL